MAIPRALPFRQIGVAFLAALGLFAARPAHAVWHGQPGSKAYRQWQKDPRSRGIQTGGPGKVVGVWGAPGMTNTPAIHGADFGRPGTRVHSIAGDFTVGSPGEVLSIRRY
jgi:hypothetical protein